jgi:hypothetical protein
MLSKGSTLGGLPVELLGGEGQPRITRLLRETLKIKNRTIP